MPLILKLNARASPTEEDMEGEQHAVDEVIHISLHLAKQGPFELRPRAMIHAVYISVSDEVVSDICTNWSSLCNG
jgi:hypothetical protein